MDVIKQVSQYFLISLSFGTFLFSFITPTKLTGAGFMRLILATCLGTLGVATLVLFSQQEIFSVKLLSIYLLNIALLVFVYIKHEDEKSKLMWGLYFVQIITYTVLCYMTQKSLMDFGNLMLAVLLAGSVNYCMILGHYYLVVPKLSEWPLLKGLKFIWIFLVLKIALSSYGYVKGADFFNSGTHLGSGYMFNWIMLSMRVLWGYVALGVLSYFAWRLCKMRSIQSATGVFYIMVFFIIVGELISGYLYYNYGLLI